MHKGKYTHFFEARSFFVLCHPTLLDCCYCTCADCIAILPSDDNEDRSGDRIFIQQQEHEITMMYRQLLSATLLVNTMLVGSFQVPCQQRRQTGNLFAKKDGQPSSRRKILARELPMLTLTALVVSSQPASALVKGVSPPSTMKPTGGKPKCTNVEECQAMAEQKEAEDRVAAEANRVPAKKTVSCGPSIIYIFSSLRPTSLHLSLLLCPGKWSCLPR